MNQLLDLQTIAGVLGAVKNMCLPFASVSIVDFQENRGV